MSKYTCPKCGGSIIIRRIDDGIITVKVTDEGQLIELGNESNGGLEIFCLENTSHKIPVDLQNELTDLYYEHY